MIVNFRGLQASNPLRREGIWQYKSAYTIVNLVVNLIWFLRIFSPGIWWGAIFSYKAPDERYYARPRPMEIYLGAVFIFAWLAGITPIFEKFSCFAVVLSVIFLLEILVYHFWIFIVRPKIDTNYIQYSGLRTIILTAMAFLNVVNLYSSIYYHGLRLHFETQLTPWLAWAYSIGEITGSGYGGTKAGATLTLAIASGSEKLVGVFFLVLIISLAVARNNTPEIGEELSRFLKPQPETPPANDEASEPTTIKEAQPEDQIEKP